MFKKMYKLWADIKNSNSGVTAIYFGLAMPVFLGFAGLAFDASLWFMERRMLQNTVDAATLSAGYAKFNEGNDTDMYTAASLMVTDNNFTVGGSNTLVVNNPPISGVYTASANYVQATMTVPADGFFSSAFGTAAFTIETTATAGIIKSGNGCLMALNRTADAAMDLTGNATVDVACAITSNSGSTESIVYGGSVSVSAEPAMVADGDIANKGNGYDLDPETELWPNSGISDDPHADLEIPTNGNIPLIETCLDTFGNGGATSSLSEAAANSVAVTESVIDGVTVHTMNPGRYCGTIPFNSGGESTVILNPGTYIIDAGDFVIGAQTNITGEGVTIILTAADPADIGNVTINGGGDINLVGQTPAQLEGNSTDTANVVMEEYAGVLLYQDRRVGPSGGADKNMINGHSDTYLSGAFYFPSQELQYNGTSSTSGGCVQIIGDTVKILGDNDTTITGGNDAACALLGLDGAVVSRVVLVE
jgi:hypothetical protein